MSCQITSTDSTMTTRTIVTAETHGVALVRATWLALAIARPFPSS